MKNTSSLSSSSSLPAVSSLLNGKNTLPSDITGEWIVKSPAKNDLQVARCVFSYAQIDQVVAASRAGQPHWAALVIENKKAELTKAYQNFVEAWPALVEQAQLEMGRSREDLELELSRVSAWWSAFQHLAPSAGDAVFEPRGVTAVLGSYVWPIFYTVQFVMMNLLMGNAVVLKPSERASLTVTRTIESLFKGTVLAGAVQVLIGEKEVGRRLACHEGVNTVIFMGSFENGMRIKQDTLSQASKEVLLFLGAKNPAILFEDVQPHAFEKIVQDVFMGSGQHCRSASVLYVHDQHYASFLEKFHERAKQIKIGGPTDKAYMGPLIDDSMLDRYLKFTGISEREGAEIYMRGKPLVTAEAGYFVTPTIASFDTLTPEQMKKSISLQTEILSPHVSVVRYQTYDEVVAICEQMQHGLCAALWGENTERLRKVGERLAVGQIQLNGSLLEWNPAQSFQARKKTGTHAYYGAKFIEQLAIQKMMG